jgi:hypothetical protein
MQSSQPFKPQAATPAQVDKVVLYTAGWRALGEETTLDEYLIGHEQGRSRSPLFFMH